MLKGLKGLKVVVERQVFVKIAWIHAIGAIANVPC
jgi:hypothetical protein